MSKEVKVLLGAVNGYGMGYLDLMLDKAAAHGAVLAGVVDPAASANHRIGEINARNIPVFADTAEFYKQHTADLAVFSTPIQLHCSNVKTALAAGSNVLCEKPLCATVDEALEMKDAEEKSGGKFVAVGYNWSFSPTIQALKKDILAGVYGAPKSLKCMVSWPRNHAYYTRNNWAGGLKSARGDWILDSPMNNATAHFLHNLFFLCGSKPELSARVVDCQAELYRANPITSFDTAAVRCHLEGGVPVHFYTTHACRDCINPVAYLEFERGTIYYQFDGTPFIGRLKDGTVRQYEVCEDMNGPSHKLWQCIEHCRSGGLPACGIEASLQHTLALNGAHLSCPQIVDFPAEEVKRVDLEEGNYMMTMPPLLTILTQCYDQGILFSEHGGVKFARPGKVIDLRNLRQFSL